MPTDETTTKPADDQIIPLGAWGGLGRGFSKHATALALQRTKGQVATRNPLRRWIGPLPNPPHNGLAYFSKRFWEHIGFYSMK